MATPRRRSDRYEHRVRLRYCSLQIDGEVEPAGGNVGRNQLIESWFEDGDFAALKSCDPVDVLIDAADAMPEVGKTGARYKPDITRSYHRNTHLSILSRQWDGCRVTRQGRAQA